MKRSSKPKAKKAPSRKPAKRKTPALAVPAPQAAEARIPGAASGPPVWSLLAGFLLVLNGVLTLPNFIILLPLKFPGDHHFMPYALMIAGFALLFWTFYRSPEPPELKELSRPWAYAWFALFYGLAFYTRFKHPETPQATFWFDDLVVYNDVRALIDYGENHLLFIFGQREPGFPYFTSFLWRLMPSMDGVFVDRLSSTLIDMVTCWGFYRLGRAISSRWLGLFLMALYSVGKPMVIYAFFGYGANTCMMSTVWMAVFFFRLVQKPLFRRFVYLGLAMGMGALTYVPARPWTPYLLLVTWAWLLWTTREKPKSREVKMLLWGGMAFWSFVAVYKNGYLPSSLGFVSLLDSWPVVILAEAALLALYYRVWSKRQEDETTGLAFGWATTALIAFLVNVPFYFQQGYASHVMESSALHVDGKMSLGFHVLAKLLDNIHDYFAVMFVQPIYDSGTYPIMFDSFFDPLPEIGMIIGLAFFLAKPTWRKGLILSLVAVGMVPFVLAELPNTARPLTSVGPLLVLAGWGTEYLVRCFAASVPSRGLRALALAGLVGLWAWNGVKSDWSIWHRWFARVSHDDFIFQTVDKDWRKYRVIIVSNFGKFETAAMTALCDQREVYEWNDPNPIYLTPGETSKDVELVYWGDDPNLAKWEDRLRKEFPEAQISPVLGFHDEDETFMKKAVIPFSAIRKKTSGMLYAVQVPADYWRRRFFCENYGWARGLVWWDDRVKDLNAPPPPKITHYETAIADGLLDAKEGGKYVLEGSASDDFIRLWVDGRKVINYYPVDGRNNSAPRVVLELTPGIHTVSISTYFKNRFTFPRILVTPPTGTPFALGE